MTTSAGRSAAERVADTTRRLECDDNVWLSTASTDGVAHLVPLSLAWIDGEVVLATPAATPTARNAAATGRARAALDDAADVVVLDGQIDVEPLDAADPGLVDRLVDRVGWDPRTEAADWVVLRLRPRRVFAWQTEPELDGRQIMKRGEWVVATTDTEHPTGAASPDPDSAPDAATPAVDDVRHWIGAKDFAVSHAFYEALGWTTTWSDGEGLAILELGGHRFMLQDHYERKWNHNSMITVATPDPEGWHERASAAIATGAFGKARCNPPADEGWATVCHVWDPSGVLLHFARFA